MLQQTQVGRVADRWVRFLELFPTPGAFAARPVAVAIEAWAGLGYNRRAVNLHRAAEAIVAQHGGAVPDSLPALLALPGVGPYTARAVLVFAFEHDEAVLDTNVARIAARVGGARLTPTAAQAALDAAVPHRRGWAWNQALIDVGALHCRSRDPRCSGCPFAPRCHWARHGRPQPDPARGSAGASSPQSRFAGSDRQARGRLVAAMCTGPLPDDRVAEVVGWLGEPGRVERVLAGLVADGLVERRPGRYVLTGSP